MRTRTIYLETKEDRDAIRKADDAEFGPRAIKGKPEDVEEPESCFTAVKVDVEAEPEFTSVEDFAEFCMDDEREQFSFNDLQKLTVTTRTSPGKIIKALEALGLKYAGRPHEKLVRGFTSNSHNLYAGNPMCGGSGFDVNGVGSRR